MFGSFYKKHIILSHIILVCCVAAFLCVFTLFFLDIWTNHGRTSLVPEVRKKSFDEATEILKKSHLKYEISDSVYDVNTPPGTVKEIWPHPGTRVKPGRMIYLTINSFEPQRITLAMPLTGVSSRQAISYLESLNIKNIRIVYVPSNFPDLVVGAKYKGKNLSPGEQIPINANIVLEVGTVTESVRQERDAMDLVDTPLPSESGQSDGDEDVDVVDTTDDDPDNVANPDIFD